MVTLAGGFLLDLILGDPQGFPHPVRWIGALIAGLEQRWNRGLSPGGKLGLGALMTVIVVGITYGVTWLVLRALTGLHPLLGQVAAVVLAYTVLAVKSLRVETEKVLTALEANDLEGARKELSFLVSRDTADLEEEQIVRGTLETIAENISDGVIAPLFYLAVGGVPLAMAYKAINTLDSMVGYRNERFEYFGKFAARLDDAANFIPARISPLLIALGAALRGFDWRGAMNIARRDGRQHNSPNSGYPEAAAAGALGIQLGGENRYFGRVTHKPLIGDRKQSLTKLQIRRMIQLLYTTSWMAAGIFLWLQWIVKGGII